MLSKYKSHKINSELCALAYRTKVLESKARHSVMFSVWFSSLPCCQDWRRRQSRWWRRRSQTRKGRCGTVTWRRDGRRRNTGGRRGRNTGPGTGRLRPGPRMNQGNRWVLDTFYTGPGTGRWRPSPRMNQGNRWVLDTFYTGPGTGRWRLGPRRNQGNRWVLDTFFGSGTVCLFVFWHILDYCSL